METKVVRFAPHKADSPEVRARLSDGAEMVTLWRLSRINRRARPIFDRVNPEVNALMSSRRNNASRIPSFWKLIDLIMAVNNGDVACRRGCSHCCHISVLLTQEEADVIGQRIGRKAVQVPYPGRNKEDSTDFDWGYHNPCPMLVNGECSIYENRPLACRLHYSLDIDALLCELTPSESKLTPNLNTLQFMKAFLQMLGLPERESVLGDIRDFFPIKSK